MYKKLTNYKKQNFQIGYQCEIKHVEIDDFDTKKANAYFRINKYIKHKEF